MPSWLKNKPIHLFYFIFITGFSILVIEFTAVSFLEPYFGKNNITWALIIALVMTSLCLGYILGGKYADKYTEIKGLYHLLNLSGLYLIGLPFFGKWLLYQYYFQASKLVSVNMMMILGTVIATVLLFGPPLITLAMAEPYIIKWYSKKLENSGTQIGEMFAWATLGGLIGLYITTLLLIPSCGSNVTFVIIGTLLCLSSTWMLITNKRYFIIIPILCFICIGIIAKQPLTGHKNLYVSLIHQTNKIKNTSFYDGKIPDIIYEAETHYQYIQIAETTDSRWLLLGSPGKYFQSIYKKNTILTGKYCDYYYLLPFLTQQPETPDILILGLAGGSISRGIKHFFPNSKIDGVEIDSKVINIAKQFFDIDKQNINIINQGAREYIKNCQKKYDIIIMDTFTNNNIPWHLTTTEFFTHVKKQLKKDGFLAINTIEKVRDVQLSMLNTLSNVFNYTYHHPNAQKKLKKQILASNIPLPTEQLAIKPTHPLYIYAKFYKNTLTHIPHNKEKIIITDNKAPTNYLLNKYHIKTITTELTKPN